MSARPGRCRPWSANRHDRHFNQIPLLIAREIPAFWLYYLRTCLG